MAEQYKLPESEATKEKARALRSNLTPELMRAIKQIESGGRANARTGSYKGLYQLSDAEFKRLGGRGDIFHPEENTRIAMLKLQQEADQVAKRLGRPLTPGEIYLVHQQGTGGAYEHITNPKRLAWESMYATGEGQEKGPKWSRLAISGNIPKQDRGRYNADNITSEDFAKLWAAQVARRGGGESGETAPVPLDPTPNVGSGQKEYDDAAAKEAAKSMVDPAPNVGSGASDYTAQSAPPVVDPAKKQIDWREIVGDALSSAGKAYGNRPDWKSTPANAAVPIAPTPSSPVSMVDPKVADAQRQQLALALQRLNAGRLV